MYPGPDLARLAARKENLLARISTRRAQCAAAGAELAVVLQKADEWREKILYWRKRADVVLSALSTVLPLLRKRGQSMGKVRRTLRWGTLAWRVFRGFRAFSGAARGE